MYTNQSNTTVFAVNKVSTKFQGQIKPDGLTDGLTELINLNSRRQHIEQHDSSCKVSRLNGFEKAEGFLHIK